MRRGRYRFAALRAASGRLNYLIGLTPEQLKALRGAARSHGLGFVLLGSRVSGPRSRQRGFSSVLAGALKLESRLRTPSPTFPGAAGVRIDKTVIKERGLDSVHTSDLTIVLIDARRPEAELGRLAERLELAFRELGTSFPVKVFAGLEGTFFAREEDFLAFGAAHLRGNLPAGHGFSEEEIRAGFRELYATVNLPRRAFTRGDLLNGAWNAGSATISFGLALGFHPVVPAMGFAFGFLGRYLARFKAKIAGAPADTFASNSWALAADAAIGAAAMALLVNPAAGFGLPLGRILSTSLLHSLSKGSVRLALDKHFSAGAERAQRRGVFLTTSLNFLQGLATAYVYAGSAAALCLQAAMAAAGLSLVYREPLSGARFWGARPRPRS